MRIDLPSTPSLISCNLLEEKQENCTPFYPEPSPQRGLIHPSIDLLRELSALRETLTDHQKKNLQSLTKKLSLIDKEIAKRKSHLEKQAERSRHWATFGKVAATLLALASIATGIPLCLSLQPLTTFVGSTLVLSGIASVGANAASLAGKDNKITFWISITASILSLGSGAYAGMIGELELGKIIQATLTGFLSAIQATNTAGQSVCLLEESRVEKSLARSDVERELTARQVQTEIMYFREMLSKMTFEEQFFKLEEKRSFLIQNIQQNGG